MVTANGNPVTTNGNPNSMPYFKSNEEAIEAFERFLRASLEYMPSTTKRTRQSIAKILKEMGKSVHEITYRDVQEYCLKIEHLVPKTRRNYKIDMGVFFRDFLRRPDLVEGMKLPYVPRKVKRGGLSKEDVQAFYAALETDEERGLCLLLASSGIRPGEALTLKVGDLDIANRCVTPKHDTKTKKSYISCFNSEAAEVLSRLIAGRKLSDFVFTMPRRVIQKRWRAISKAMNIGVTMQALRIWFSDEMGRLRVPDRYIDAFQGRLPRSVLATHYTEYSQGTLKAIYEQAGLRILA